MAQLPGAQHPGGDVKLGAARRLVQRLLQQALLVVMQELLVGAIGGPLGELAGEAGDLGE
jgi:hypothetical protein